MRHAVLVTMRELARVEAALRALGLWCAPSAAISCCCDVGSAAQRIYEGLLRVGLIVRPVGGYGLSEYLRMSIGLPARE